MLCVDMPINGGQYLVVIIIGSTLLVVHICINHQISMITNQLYIAVIGITDVLWVYICV
jgi:hypothetical protein